MKIPSLLASVIFEEQRITLEHLEAVRSGNHELTRTKTHELARIMRTRRELTPRYA